MPGSPPVTKALRIAVIVIASFYAVLFAVLVIVQLGYPFELEFMEGLIADHALRLLQGLPIYDRPNLDFIATIYPPLYYYLSAGVMQLVGVGFLAPRLLSVLATLGTCYLIYSLVRQQTKGRSAALLGPLLYLAAFGTCGFFYDVARVDALFLFLVVAGHAALLVKDDSSLGYGRVVGAALIFALAFFGKQQAILFLIPAALWLALRSWKQAVLFAMSAAAAIVIGVEYLDHVNNGWFSYYVFTIPKALGIHFNLYSFFASIPTLFLRYWSIAFLAVIAWASSTGEPLNRLRSNLGLLVVFFATSIAALMISYGNDGGYLNVAMPMAAAISILFPLALHQLVDRKQIDSRGAYVALLIQFAVLWTSPRWDGQIFGAPADRVAGEKFLKRLSSMPGRVLVPTHAFLDHLAGKPMQFHMIGYKGVMIANDEHARAFQRSYDSALRAHVFSAVILDEAPGTPTDSVSGYTFSGRLFQEPRVFSSKLLDIGTRPQYVFLPK